MKTTEPLPSPDPPKRRKGLTGKGSSRSDLPGRREKSRLAPRPVRSTARDVATAGEQIAARRGEGRVDRAGRLAAPVGI